MFFSTWRPDLNSTMAPSQCSWRITKHLNSSVVSVNYYLLLLNEHWIKMLFLLNYVKQISKILVLMLNTYPFSPFLIYFCTSRTPLLRLFLFGATNIKQICLISSVKNVHTLDVTSAGTKDSGQSTSTRIHIGHMVQYWHPPKFNWN